jgi:uroporphyrinogen decarboxylase
MKARERFKRCTHFKDIDRLPRFETYWFWPETLQRWYKEGLPLGVDIGDYFGFDKREELFLNCDPIPNFVPKTFEETGRYIVSRDIIGRVTKTLKTGTTMPTFLEYPVKNRKDWKLMKRRHNSHDLRRYPRMWSEDLFEYYNSIKDATVGLIFLGLFWKARDLLGTTRLLTSFYRDPDWIQDIMDFYTDFLFQLLKPAVENILFDYVIMFEDMAYNKGPHISPQMFRKFILPNYKKITKLLKTNGIDVIMLDTDGNPNVLISQYLEGGFNCIIPMEVAAGVDAIQLRKEYGKKLLFVGNIDKRSLEGEKSLIEKEVTKKLELTREGGYIPHIDHQVPSNISLENYRYFNDLVKAHNPYK